MGRSTAGIGLDIGVGIGVGVMDTATASTNIKGGNVMPVPRGMQEDTIDGLESTEGKDPVRDKAISNPKASCAGGGLTRTGPGASAASTVVQSPHTDPKNTSSGRDVGEKGSLTTTRSGAHVNGATVQSRGVDPVAPAVGSGAAVCRTQYCVG